MSMTSVLFALVPKPVIAGLAALSILAAGVQTVRLHLANQTIEKRDAQLVAKAGELTQCQNDWLALDNARIHQNEALRAVAREGERRAALAQQAMADAQRANSATKSRIAAIQNAQAGADQCASSDALILEAMR